MVRAHPTPACGGGSRSQHAAAAARNAGRGSLRVLPPRNQGSHCTRGARAMLLPGHRPQDAAGAAVPIAFGTEVPRTTGAAGMEPDGIHADIPVLLESGVTGLLLERDSNPRHSTSKVDALPTELSIGGCDGNRTRDPG